MQDHSDLVNKLGIQLPSAEHKITSPMFPSDIEVHVKRDDWLHPVISGNKWRKLKAHLYQAQAHHTSMLVSFGGGFSNHLHALGYCCRELGIKLMAIIRGDYSRQLTPMLQDLSNWGVELKFVSKVEYQQRSSPEYLNQLQAEFPQATIIPEGGSNSSALEGVSEVITELQNQYDYLVCPVASGGTLAGLATGICNARLNTTLLGIGVLKGEEYLEVLVKQLLPEGVPMPTIIHDYHCGGYAKVPEYLQNFCCQFTPETQVPVEPVYSGKLFYALTQLANKGYFPSGSRVLALHTGGLQGARST